MLRGEILLSNGSPNLALRMYSEVINLFPDVVEAHEQRARCYLNLVKKTFLSMVLVFYLSFIIKVLSRNEKFHASTHF